MTTPVIPDPFFSQREKHRAGLASVQVLPGVIQNKYKKKKAWKDRVPSHLRTRSHRKLAGTRELREFQLRNTQSDTNHPNGKTGVCTCRHPYVGMPTNFKSRFVDIYKVFPIAELRVILDKPPLRKRWEV